jgi:hypothetical protein
MTPSTMKAEGRKHLPSISDTQTFAARNDLVEWTRKIPSLPPSADESEVEASSVHDPGIVQDEPQPTTGDRTSDVGQSRSRWPMVGLVAGGLALVIWGAPRVFSSNIPPEPISNAKPRESESAPAPPLTVPKTVPSPSETPRVVPSVPPTRSTAPKVASATDAAAPAGSATLVVTANPRSFATVRKQSGFTPFTVTLPAGTHSVFFQNDLLNLKTNAVVSLKPGQKYTVFVDFTKPSPSITSN